MVMATQTFVTDMQAINSSSVQQVQQSGHGSSDTKTIQVTSSGQTPSIIQSTTQSGQQFIVTISGDPTDQQVQEAVQLSQGSGQVIYPSHQYSDYQSSMYTPVSGTYYQGQQMSTGLSGMQGQILTHQGGTYLVQSGTMDGEGHPLTHTTRASPATVSREQMASEPGPSTSSTTSSSSSNTEHTRLLLLTTERRLGTSSEGDICFGEPGLTLPGAGGANGPRNSNFDAKCWQRENLPIVGHTVQWLIDNYETAEGVSLPRSTLYNHYLRHCSEQKMDPMNPASFGKLIRSVFLGLRTRRLGTRGNSKYHYYGIRIKATSPLNQFSDDQTMAMRQTPSNQKRVAVYKDGTDESESSQSADTPQPTPQQHQHQQFLGDASAAIPNFGSIDPGNKPLPDGVSHEHLRIFEQLYKEHSEAILEVVVNLQFNVIEHLWQQFWRNSSPDTVQNGETAMEMRLPKDKLYAMCRMEAVQKHVRRSDYAFYQALVEVLIPDVLRPIPSSLTQAIRNFAKSLESWLKTAMVGVPDEMMKTKVSSVGAFAQTLRRYTSLNHLAQAARAVLQNTSQINQMLTDLNRVDFVNVQEQASWVCQCEDSVVHQLEQDFKKTLQQQNSLEQWAIWLESVVNQVLKPYEGTPNFPKAARQFLLKWSFYSSMVIRDLTLRSAASFGSFHLIRLLYDEYMFYLVERKVSAATGETPIAVMGEFAELGGMMSIANQDSDSDVKSESSLTQQHITTLGNNTITLLPASSATLPSTSALNHTMASSFTNNSPTTVTVLTGAHGTPKTIVVVPVSSSGDGPTAKRVKMM